MRRLRYVRRLATAGAAATLTVVLAQNTTSASFTSVAADLGNQVTAASTFCASSGGQTVYASEDTTGYQSNPTSNFGTNVQLGTLSASTANTRVFLRFPLTGVVPTHCVITGATLRLWANAPTSLRTIDTYQVDPAATPWTEMGLNWNNMPATAGTAVSSASLSSIGWQTWAVPAMTKAMVEGVNNGFLVRDSVDNASPTKANYYDSRETTTPANKPQLVLTWG